MIRDISYIGEGLIQAPNDGPALRYNPLHEEDVTDIAVHQWTGWLPPETWTTGEEIAYIVRIDQYHRTTRGLDGIGYQVCVFPSGRVYITARLDKYGAHVGYENNHLIGLALPGTFNLNTPSPKHLEGCREAVRYIYDYLDREVPTTPHLNWGETTCPGDRWREWVPQLTQTEEEEMNHIIQVTPEQYYFVGPGYRTFLGATPTGLAESGVPVLAIGQPGAPATLESLWEIPSLEEMILGYVKKAGKEGTG